MKHTTLFAGALLALAPVVALTLPGCSGGNGGLVSPTATPTGSAVPTSTTSPTTTPTQVATQASNLTLGNGQRAILTTNVTGTNISGLIQILPSTAAMGRTTRAIPFTFAVGTYNFTGTVTPPRGYSIQGDFGTFGAFQMNGRLPTATQTGTYTLTVNGQTETGVVPIPGQAFPTPTPTATVPSGGNYNLTGNLTFSGVSAGSDVVSTPITSFSDLSDGGKITNTTVNGATYQVVAFAGVNGPVTGNGTRRSLSGALPSYESFTNLKPFSVGQVINSGVQLQLGQTAVQGTSVKIGAWRNTSGTATIKAVGTNSISFELNAHFEPTAFGGGKGSFDLKGTITATGLEVKNQ